jgi:phospholipid-binding lipoprotein MlaA
MLSNFYTNLREPLYFANNLLQGSFKRSAISLGRFTINSTLGVAGFFDFADYWFGLEVKTEDFGQTLAVYGMPEGPFLFIPFLGPSSIRGVLGSAVELVGDPFQYILRLPDLRSFDNNSQIIIQMRGPVRALEIRGSAERFIRQVERESIDYYATVRGLYRQNRRNAILNGELDFNALPKIPDDDFFDQ